MSTRIAFFHGLSFLFLLTSACQDNVSVRKKPIILGDTNSIVTESDSVYLRNFTDDISPVNKKSSESDITKMMVQVDSAKSSKKLEENTQPKQISGFTINFEECSVTFDGLSAHAIQNTQDERHLNSVSYVKDIGDFMEMQLEVTGLSEVRLEQRLFTRLVVRLENETITLLDLGKYITPWYNLAGKNNRFISVGSNSIQYEQVDKNKIRNALDKELRKKKKSVTEMNNWLNAIKNVSNYTDAPCELKVVSGQWRIWGKKDGRTVRKLIQFDVP
ncbi:MAG: hypothetical protein JNJ58_06390 [Chitinophagaceae bacterium]|nr:hypothetical protein [Chitinophagaceae bacterium]